MDEIKKGGKKAVLGEIRTYSNQKWKKTTSGWELVKDVHKARGDGHTAEVHTVTPDKVHYHVIDHEGKKVANAKMSHQDFANNYVPVTIHHPNGGSPNQEHVAKYVGVMPEESSLEQPVDSEVESEEELDEVPNKPVIEVDDEDADLDIAPTEDLDDDEAFDEVIIPEPKTISHNVGPKEAAIGDSVNFITDGNKRSGIVSDVAPNGVLTIISGSRTHYISKNRLI
jgi:hypothetical protein